MKLIVDASVAVKWLFTEERSAESRQLLAHRIVLHAPDFILTEAANVIWKKARRKEIADPQPYIEELAGMPDVVVLRPAADLVAHASAIALKIDHPVYDCLYLACAEVEAAPLVTADGKLRDAAEAYPGVEVWHIAVPDVGKRIVTAATALVIQESTVRELIAAYAALQRHSGHRCRYRPTPTRRGQDPHAGRSGRLLRHAGLSEPGQSNRQFV